jgi:hypothetical protein
MQDSISWKSSAPESRAHPQAHRSRQGSATYGMQTVMKDITKLRRTMIVAQANANEVIE